MRTDMPSLPVAAAEPEPLPLGGTRRYQWPVIASACLIAVINIFVIAGLHLPPFLGPALGFWFLVIQPVYLVYTTSFWGGSASAERFGYSLTTVLLTLMIAGLVADLVLPFVGVRHPLDPIPVVIGADGFTLLLYVIRQRYPGERLTLAHLSAFRRAIGPEEVRLLCGSALCVALAVLGANRLNNDAGDQVSLAALCVAVLTLLFLLLWRHRVSETITCVTLYLLSLALLLMTSLRGWYVTGHDIQTEYQVFQLTQANGRWEIAAFHNAYNACLSITILPTELANILHVDGPYIYKVFFQLIFAVCPVLVYTIARRYWPASISILAAIYFISFPTFFTDMPFINRQEIALLFVAVAVLALTHGSWDGRRRQLTFIVACAGVEVCHYSSTYILLGFLVVAWVIQLAMGLGHRLQRRRAAHAEPPPWANAIRTVGIGSIVTVGALTFGWGYLATHSAGAVLTDAESAISSLVGHSTGARSQNVGYSLLFGKTPTPQQVLNDYTSADLKLRAATAYDTNYIEPQSTASQTQIKAVTEPLLPLTSAGRLLADIGVPVSGLNTFIRLSAAALEQIFIGAGLIAFIVARRFRRQIGWEFFCLCVGCVAMLAVVTVVPDLSVDYGLLRVFQEALILIAPVLVAGSVAIFGAFGKARAPYVAAAVCVGIFISTTGLLPQALGGYPAQLSLNNSGQYYDTYYMHPQEEVGVQWLSRQVGVLPSSVQATHSTNRFLFTDPNAVSGAQFIEDAFPPLLRLHAWIILDYSILHTGLATASYDGYLIPYRYPQGILRNAENLVYNNGGMEIYR
jgi:uncharacterized membrane protein